MSNELKKIIVDGVEYTLPEGGGGGSSSDIVKIPITMTSSSDGTGTITDEDLTKIQNGSAVVLTIPGMSVVITDLITSDGIGYYGGAQISLGEDTDINGEPVLQARNVILAINGETKTCIAGIEYLDLLKIPNGSSSGSSDIVKVSVTMSSMTSGTATLSDEDYAKIQNGATILLSVPGMSCIITALQTTDGTNYTGGTVLSVSKGFEDSIIFLYTQEVTILIDGSTKVCEINLESRDLIRPTGKVEANNDSPVTSSGVFYALKNSSSGSGNVFEDVTALPETPDTQKIYRVSDPEIYMYVNGLGLLNFAEEMKAQGVSVIIESVNSLPENPEKVINMETFVAHIYILNNDIYGYNALGDNQWLRGTALLHATEMGLGYGGVITNETSFVDGYFYLGYSEPKYVNISNSGTYRFIRDYELLATASLEVTDTSSTFINFADVTIVKNGGDLKQDLKAVIKIKPVGVDSDGFSTDLTCDVELKSLINSRTSNLNMWNKIGSTFLGLNSGYVYIVVISLSGTTSMDNGIGFQLHLTDYDFKDTNIGVGNYTVEIYGR